MKLRFDNKVEFYITNVCNYTCDNCNRFNNYQFSGWQRWSDYADIYRRWSELIELQAIVLMGGEPTLNPTVTEWVHGLNQIFDCDVQVLTNGTRLNDTPGLYESMLIQSPGRKAQNHIGISLHNLADFDNLRQEVLKFLSDGIIEWGSVLDKPAPTHMPAYFFKSFYAAQDQNNVRVNMHVGNRFQTAALQVNHAGDFVVHQSNPQKAHDQCGFVKFKSYHFIKGSIYKCGPAALLPDFDMQHQIQLTNDERQVMHSYQPLTIDNFEYYKDTWLESLQNPIAQCRFCPETFNDTIITPGLKGRVIKINTSRGDLNG